MNSEIDLEQIAAEVREDFEEEIQEALTNAVREVINEEFDDICASVANRPGVSREEFHRFLKKAVTERKRELREELNGEVREQFEAEIQYWIADRTGKGPRNDPDTGGKRAAHQAIAGLAGVNNGAWMHRG